MKKLLLTFLVALNILAFVSPAFANTDPELASVESSSTDSTSTASEATKVDAPVIFQPDFLPGPTEGTTGGTLQDYVLNTAVPHVFNIGIGLLAITAFLGILISAIQLLTAYGDESKLGRGKTNLRYSIFGFIIVMMAYAIVSIVVSVALPQQSAQAETSLISWVVPTAHAVDVKNDPSILLPSVQTMIESQDEQGRVSLPSGDFLGEIVPAIVTNIMYFVGFLIFISFVYGGALIVMERGNEEAVTKAKGIIMWSAIALALISLGYAIIVGIATLNLNQDSTTVNDDLYTDTQNQSQ